MTQVGDIHGIPVVTDDTLPPDCLKMLGSGVATVFRIDAETGKALIVAQWPEVDVTPSR